jgi:predicted ATPase
MRYRMLNTGFKLALVVGLVAMGLFGKALALINETISLVEANGDLIHMPEALRVQGNVLLAMPKRRADDAERCFIRSLEWSRRQGARSWELRAAVDLAALWVAQGRFERAGAVLEPIFEAFEEGLDTADLQAAERLLATLR